MKNFKVTAVLLVLMVAAISVSASNNPISGPNAILLTNSVEISYSENSLKDMIIDTDYNEETKKLSVTTAREISFLQVLNQDGEIEYQLPIGTDVIYLNFDQFDLGEYKLNLLIEGGQDFLSLDMNKK